MAYLHGFRPLKVGPALAQEDAVRWLSDALRRARGGKLGPQELRALKLYERLGRGDFVRARSTAVPDFFRRDWGAMTLFRGRRGSEWHAPPLETRMALYEKTVMSLAERAFPAGEDEPDHALQVSCTGYSSPHAIQRIVGRRRWSTRLLHVGHMGCYAALPAASTAARLVRADAADGEPRSTAALFVVELCTLHLKPGASADDQVVVNSLFSDGAIRFDVSAVPRHPCLALLASDQQVLPRTEEHMTWRLGDSAFGMTLGRGVPEEVGAAVTAFVKRFLGEAGLKLSDVKHFAIHPGGPRVIERVLAALWAPPDAGRHSREVLRRRGNMSSATLPHVWDAMLEDPAVRAGDLILSLAFGPGLTIAANVLRKTE